MELAKIRNLSDDELAAQVKATGNSSFAFAFRSRLDRTTE